MGSLQPTLRRLPAGLRHNKLVLPRSSVVLSRDDRDGGGAATGQGRGSTHQDRGGQQVRLGRATGREQRPGFRLGADEEVWIHGDECTGDGQY